MLAKIFASFTQTRKAPQAGPDALPGAIAALLVEAARADEEYTDQERALIDHMLGAQFGLSPAEAASVRSGAEDAQAAAHDLYSFSRIVKTELDHQGKCTLIEDMWVIALSDQDKAPYEEMIIRRLVGLIHLEDADSTAARKRAVARHQS